MFEKRIFPAITHLIYRINNTSILEEFSKSFIECFSQSKYFNTYSVYKLILYYNLGTFRNEVLKYNTIIYTLLKLSSVNPEIENIIRTLKGNYHKVKLYNIN